MKTLVLSTALWITATGAFAQDGSDTTRIQLGDTKVIVINDNDSTKFDFDEESDDKLALTHLDGIDLGVNILLNADNKTEMGVGNEWLELDYARSLSWKFTFLEEKVRLVKDYVGIAIGGSIVYNSYGLKNNYTIVSNTTAMPDTIFAVQDTVLEFTKNKLRTASLQMPLLLEFNTSSDPEKTFHVAAGVIGGWRYGAITKQRYEYEGDEVKVRQKEDFNVVPFTLEATARVGYRGFTLFGTYSLTPLFEKGNGPEVYPVTLGISVVPFS